MAKLLRVDRKATMTQATTCYRQEQQKATKDTAPISLERETENTVCSSSNFETGGKLPGLSLNFYCNIQMGRSEFKNLVLSCHGSTVEDASGNIMVWGMFSWETQSSELI